MVNLIDSKMAFLVLSVTDVVNDKLTFLICVTDLINDTVTFPI